MCHHHNCYSRTSDSYAFLFLLTYTSCVSLMFPFFLTSSYMHFLWWEPYARVLLPSPLLCSSISIPLHSLLPWLPVQPDIIILVVVSAVSSITSTTYIYPRTLEKLLRPWRRHTRMMERRPVLIQWYDERNPCLTRYEWGMITIIAYSSPWIWLFTFHIKLPVAAQHIRFDICRASGLLAWELRLTSRWLLKLPEREETGVSLQSGGEYVLIS